MKRIREIPSFGYDPNCVLYLPLWKRDSNVSFISDDAYGHLCTVTGATWGTQGRTFDGIDDGINFGNDSSLQMNTVLTIIVWVKLKRTANYEYILSKGFAWDNGWWIQKNVDSMSVIFNWLGAGGGQSSSSLDLTINTWQQIAFTFLNGTTTRYLMGNLIGSADTSVDTVILGVNTSNLRIGISTDGSSFPTQCDAGEVRIYNRALTASEILQTYNATKWRYV